MAVKAQVSITISHLIDISSITRYYLLQSSTSAAPAKPTTNPPSSSWVKTEPSYTSGSTNTLYFVDCTEFTNGTFKYSEVSKSSSYEAAKEAYNKATAVETRVTKAETAINQNKKAIALRATKTEVTTEIQSVQNGNLVKNGYGEYLNMTNFINGTFTRGDCPDGAYGYFRNVMSKDYIPYNKNFTYDVEFYCRLRSGLTGVNYSYFGLAPYDVDGLIIDEENVLNYNTSLFYLSQDLKDGDTVAHFTDLTNWKIGTTQEYQRSFLVFGYTDSTGYTYPDGTYSRNFYCSVYSDDSAINKSNNTITLSKAWNKGTVTAGTCIAQSSRGSTYCYYGQNGRMSNTEWEKRSATIIADKDGKYGTPGRRLWYAKSIQVVTVNTTADYAAIYLGIHTVDKDARQGIDTANSNINKNAEAITKNAEAIDNIQVGGRNLLVGTSNPVTHTGTGLTNQCTNLYNTSDYYRGITDFDGKTFTLSFDWETTATSGTFLVQLNGTPWLMMSQQFAVSSSNNSGRSVFTFSGNSNLGTGNYNGIQIRSDNLTGTVTIKNAMFETGNKPSSWQPAPEDIDDNINDTAENLNTVLTKTITDHVAAIQENSDSIVASVEKLQTTVNEDINGLRDDIETVRNKVELQLTEDEVNIQIDKKLQNGVNKVETSTGFKFDEDGLNVSKSGSPTNTQITENGMKVKNTESGDDMLTADKDGVDAKNLRASTYLIVGGRSRFENYGTNRTGCFWIGE